MTNSEQGRSVKKQQSIKTLIIEPLSHYHNRSSFQCGESSLDNYIKKLAKQDVKRRISQVYIAVESENPSTIVGFYTLSTLSIELNDLPESLACKLPIYPVPAALIGRLAVSEQAQGMGVGKMLIVDAIKRILAISNEIAIYAMIVDTLNDEAKSFYTQFGFTQLNTQNQRLFLPLKSI